MKKILFIEDESALQKTLGQSLEQEGFKMISALNGKDGFNLAKAKKPDLIILDLILPKMDGFEVLKRLKQSSSTKEIPVVILTNLERMKDVNRALEMGATTYLVKANYSLEDIVQKISQILK